MGKPFLSQVCPWMKAVGQFRDSGCYSTAQTRICGLGWRGCSWPWSQLWVDGLSAGLCWTPRSQWSPSICLQNLVFSPISGTTVMLEQQHSKGWECSGELQGGTVAVDLLIKINVLADKDDSAPIAITSQDPARQRAAHSCFLSTWSLCLAA